MKRTLVLLACVLGVLLPRQSLGQAAEARLASAVSASAHRQIMRYVEAADSAEVPSMALVRKALEGSSKGADEASILQAVVRLYDRLLAAKTALPPGTRADELESAAAALFAGATPEMLREIDGPSSGRSLAGAYTTLAFVLQHGVAAAPAVRSIGELVRANSTNADFLALQTRLTADIAGGTRAEDSLLRRSREIVGGRDSRDLQTPGGR